MLKQLLSYKYVNWQDVDTKDLKEVKSNTFKNIYYIYRGEELVEVVGDNSLANDAYAVYDSLKNGLNPAYRGVLQEYLDCE